jgi:hypothetical protein
MPHTWVGTDYVRSVIDLFAYTRGADSSLVIGAGLPRAWVAEGEGVRVAKLPTPFGELGYRMKGAICELDAMRVPPGGIVVAPPPPAAKAWRSATIDGRPAKLERGRVTVTTLPARIEFR